MARAQLEFTGLLTRRAQAYMEIPGRLSQCRNPQDLINEQVRFWRIAFEEYTESTGRITTALASCALSPSAFGSGEPENKHDYITFPETKEPARASRDRKAA